MTAHARRRLPGRGPTPADSPNGEIASAQADVAAARETVEALRRQVAKREAGASSLHTAEYQLAGALRRLDEARRQAVSTSVDTDPDDDPLAAA